MVETPDTTSDVPDNYLLQITRTKAKIPDALMGIAPRDEKGLGEPACPTVSQDAAAVHGRHKGRRYTTAAVSL